MTGILLINHFLQTEKFNQLHTHLINAAKKSNIDLKIKTNMELAVKRKKCDFVLFWDKDVRLAFSLEKEGYPVFNSAKSIALCDDKSLTYEALKNVVNQPLTFTAPLTFFSNSDFDLFINSAVDILKFPLVYKECFGSFGEGVFLCKNIKDIKSHINNKPFLLQKYVPSNPPYDYRLEIVGGECVAAMKRSGTSFITNITKGGKAEKYTPTLKEKETAIKAANALGLTFCGVDLFPDGTLCEVNSNAHIINIMECTGIDVAPFIFDEIRGKIQ